jgi:hypothetical protein
MSPCRAHRGTSRTSFREGKPACFLQLRCRIATKTPYAPSGPRDITDQITQLTCETPLTGVLALATNPVPADRSNLSEGQPE